MLENCVKDAFNQTLKETFKESLVDDPVYSSYIMPKEKSARDYTVFAQVKFNRWLVNRFKVGGIDSDMFGYYEGLTEGRNSDKAVYTRTQLGTIFDFAVPGGFLISDKRKLTPLRVSGEPTEPVNPLLQLVRTDLDQKKSNLNTLLNYLPEKTKYKVGGITGTEYEFQEKPYVAIVPRQGKTIVGVVFLSHQPGGKKTKGTKLRVQEQEFEVGVPHGGNLVNAYHLIRHFQDMPDICKVDTPRTAEVPPITDFAKKSSGSILEFLALEVARESYASGSPPISLKDFLTIQGSVPELEKQINEEYTDIKPAKWGLIQSV